MKFSLALTVAGLLLPNALAAITLNPDDPASVKNAAKSVAANLRKWYTGDKPGDVPGNLPAPYYWWLCGAMFGGFIDYWHYTGDDQYNNITSQAMIHQIGQPEAFMPPNQTKTLGNDDQAFWGMAAMSAAENKFPDVNGQMSWLSLAIAVFNTQVPRWNTKTCGGGLNWQIFTFNNGFDYKNTISNGAFFNIAARLAKYTQNQTYAEWAGKAWEWEMALGLISNDYHFFDGVTERNNCTEVNKIQWTYNAGIHMAGAAALWNMSETMGNKDGAAKWKGRLQNIIKGTDIFYSADGVPNVMIEIACENNGLCDDDQRSFKAYLARHMGWTMLVAPFTRNDLMPRLKTSALAAAKSCAGPDGATCGMRWWKNTFDGQIGVGEQMSALEVMQNLLIDQTPGPVGENTGGVSKNDPAAGTQPQSLRPNLDVITAGDKAGAAILTILVIVGILAGSFWLLQGE